MDWNSDDAVYMGLIYIICVGAGMMLFRRTKTRGGGDNKAEASAAEATAAAADGGSDLPSPAAVLALAKKRRSIFPKDFCADPVRDIPKDVIDELVLAANWAPTHGKTEPWRFVVLERPAISKFFFDVKVRVSEEMLKDKPEALEAFKAKVARKAADWKKVSRAVVIVMAPVTNSKGKLMPEWEEVAAVSCAIQNMHLQLTSRWDEGYGGYWTSGGAAEDGWMNSSESHAFLGLDHPPGGDGEAKKDDDKGFSLSPDRRHRVLGAFVLGCVEGGKKKMDKIRCKRGPVEDKTRWM